MFSFDRPLDHDDARLALTDAIRSVVADLTSSTTSDEAFEEARDLVERAAQVLAVRAQQRGYEHAEASLGDHRGGSFLDFSPLIGTLNPLAPPIRVRVADDRVVAMVTYGPAYEGPPGCVHGGFIAAGFDEVCGLAQSLGGQPGMTGRLTVSYRSPTPLGRPLRYEARIDRIEGRKIYTTATLHRPDEGAGEASGDGRDVLCAEAEGLFISMKPEVFQRLMRDRAGRPG